MIFHPNKKKFQKLTNTPSFLAGLWGQPKGGKGRKTSAPGSHLYRISLALLFTTYMTRLARNSRPFPFLLSIHFRSRQKRSTPLFRSFFLAFLTVMSARRRSAPAIISGALISEAVDTSPATAVRLPIAVLPEVLRPSERRLAPQQLEHPAPTVRPDLT